MSKIHSLNYRLLEEEFQKREELERLKAEQDDLLASERQKREGRFFEIRILIALSMKCIKFKTPHMYYIKLLAIY